MDKTIMYDSLPPSLNIQNTQIVSTSPFVFSQT
jgi:hypothetical protein